MEKYEAVIGFYKAYMGEGTHLTLFWCAMFLLVILALKKNDLVSKKIVIYVGLISIIYWNPTTSEFLLKYLTGYNVYCRMFWMFPISIVIAYGATYAISIMDKKIKRIIALLVLTVIIAFTGKYMFTEENFSDAENMSKLPNSVPEICEIIENDANINDVDNIKAIVEDCLVCYIRQYDGNIKMNYGRPNLAYDNAYRSALNAEAFDIRDLLELAYSSGSNYLVLYSYKDITSAVESGRCRNVANVGNYRIYFVNDNNENNANS